jgi:predicted Fe-S protein YdhL (DUF1289 family)
MPPESPSFSVSRAQRPQRRPKLDPATRYQRLLSARVPDALACLYAPPSPCISVCQMDAQTGWCLGCLRDIEEIGAWSTNTDDDKRAVWKRIGERLEFLK